MAGKKLGDTSVPVATSLTGITLYGVKGGVTYRVPTSLFAQSSGGGGTTPDPTPTNSDTPTTFTDSLINIDRGTHIETSPLARAIYTTSATSVTINGYTNLASFAQPQSELGVLVNGVWLQSINPTADGAFSAVLTLGSGNKTIEIVNGAQAKPSGTILGTFLKSISANALLTRSLPPAGVRSVFLVDSIGVGDSASIPTKLSYISWLRKATTDSLVVYGWGYNGLLDIAGDSTKRSNLVSLLTAAGPTRVVVALGTNDYGLNKGSAGAFQAAYASLNADIHAALPSASIIAITPLLRASETANGSGNTLGDYRVAAISAASGKSWVQVLDGTTFVPLSEMSDGLHPDDYGHWLYASAIDGVLGYTVPSYFSAPLVASDSNGAVTDLGGGKYRLAKIAGGIAFDCGFAGAPQTGDFRYSIKVTGFQDVMIGVSSSPTASPGYADMAAQVYLGGPSANNIIAYNGPTSGSAVGTYVDGDVIWVDRTGNVVTWKIGTSYSGGTTLRTANVSGTIGLDISKAGTAGTLEVTPNAGDGAAAAELVAQSTFTTVTSPSAGVYRATKSGGGGAFNAGAQGLVQAGDFRYKLVPAALADIIFGVNPAASTDPGYTDIDLAIYLTGDGATANATEGAIGSSSGTYAGGDVLWVDRTGSTVTFKKGADYASATSLRTGTLAGSIALDLSIYQQGAAIDVQKVS